jgi:hypothetical protein
VYCCDENGLVLVLVTPRPASPGDTRDGSHNRACPSSDARRSTPPSSSSPPASAPPKPPSLNPPWKPAVYPRSKAKISNGRFRIRKAFPDPVSVSITNRESYLSRWRSRFILSMPKSGNCSMTYPMIDAPSLWGEPRRGHGETVIRNRRAYLEG